MEVVNMKLLNFCCGLKVMGKSCLFKNATLFLIIVGVGIVVTLCQLLGCTKSTPPPPTDEIVGIVFKDNDNSRSVSELRTEIEIYVDGSGSMRGFVNQQGNTVFSRLMRSLASLSLPQYGVSFFKFGTGNPQELSLQEFWQMSSNQSLFDQSTTRLDLTMRSFLEEERPAGAYLVITDGVQASPIGCDYPSFVNPINQWLGKNNHILHIYAFRGEFNGTIWSANTGNHFHYESNPNNPASFRPFYVYAFILDRNLENRFIAEMQNIIRDLEVRCHFLNFSDQIIKKSGLEFKLPVKLERRDKKKNRFRKYYKPKEERGKTIIFLRWPGMEKGLGEGYLKVKFGLVLTDFGREILQNLDRRVARDVKIWHWKREKRVTKNPKGATKIDYTWISQQIADEDRYLSEVESIRRTRGEGLPKPSITFRFQRMPETGWYAYYIRLLPRDDAFRVPGWVENWSTMDDSTIESANRTLNFENVVSSILNNAPVRERILADFFVMINFR